MTKTRDTATMLVQIFAPRQSRDGTTCMDLCYRVLMDGLWTLRFVCPCETSCRVGSGQLLPLSSSWTENCAPGSKEFRRFFQARLAMAPMKSSIREKAQTTSCCCSRSGQGRGVWRVTALDSTAGEHVLAVTERTPLRCSRADVGTDG